jgi:small subunit ribosomal protein S14
MARASQWAKANRAPKCRVCGRSRAFYRDFALCRLCFRLFALRGELPGVTKASW